MILLDFILKMFTMTIVATGNVEGALRGDNQPGKREEK